MSEILTNLRVDGSIRSVTDFNAFMKQAPGVTPKYFGQRLNAVDAPTVADFVTISGAVSVVVGALAAYRKATKRKISFHENGQLKSADNYSPEELAKLMPTIERIELSEPEPDKVIEGFAQKPPKPED